MRAHEDSLLGLLLAGLATMPGVRVHGAAAERTPTVMFTVDGLPAERVATALAEREVAVWHGNYYAYELFNHLGLAADGAIRAGIAHYNDARDVERLLEGVGQLSGAAWP